MVFKRGSPTDLFGYNGVDFQQLFCNGIRWGFNEKWFSIFFEMGLKQQFMGAHNGIVSHQYTFLGSVKKWYIYVRNADLKGHKEFLNPFKVEIVMFYRHAESRIYTDLPHGFRCWSLGVPYSQTSNVLTLV